MGLAKRLAAALLLLAGLAGPVTATPSAVVDLVQAPAWVERGGVRKPLQPGLSLENHDRLVTGAGARAIVQMADGSAVKFGENASVAVNALGQREGGVFTAALDVARGAFRLTTDIFRRFQSQRAINVRVGTVTIGIRGTDLWGRTDAERDFVCLLEGRIAVTHPLADAVLLDSPLQFYGADKGKAPGPVAVAEREQLAKWALETEPVAGAGMQRQGGRWALRIAVLESEGEALALLDRLAATGYGAKVLPQRAAGGYRYELRLGSIPGEGEANLLADRMARDMAIPRPTVIGR